MCGMAGRKGELGILGLVLNDAASYIDAISSSAQRFVQAEWISTRIWDPSIPMCRLHDTTSNCLITEAPCDSFLA
jgi:hypothetical protein